MAHYTTLTERGDRTLPLFTHGAAPTDGTSGTYANVAGKGSLLLDTANGALYQNTNTLASPTWTALTTATGAGTYTGTFNGTVGATTPAAATVTTLAVSAATGITASTTQTRAGGTALTKSINVVATVANSGDAVTLPAMSVGQTVIVFNAGASPLAVFPNGASDTIDGGSGGAKVTLTNAKRALFVCVAANTILSAQLGVAAA